MNEIIETFKTKYNINLKHIDPIPYHGDEITILHFDLEGSDFDYDDTGDDKHIKPLTKYLEEIEISSLYHIPPVFQRYYNNLKVYVYERTDEHIYGSHV